MQILINIIPQMFHFSRKSLIISRMREDLKLNEKKLSVNHKLKAAETLELSDKDIVSYH